MSLVRLATTPFRDQKPGTSGLRKAVVVFQQPNYLANFVQATFDALPAAGIEKPKTLVLGGDGRYYGAEACQTIIKIAAANDAELVIVGQNGIFSTPAVSAVVRNRAERPTGAFILTASHNPGGPTEDFGIKYNVANGGPAPEKVTNVIYEKTLAIAHIHWCCLADVDLSVQGDTVVTLSNGRPFTVRVISSTADYVHLLKSVFNFDRLRLLLVRHDFKFAFDAMNGVGGPYAKAVFIDELGAKADLIRNICPKSDFGGLHPDPNLTYAKELVLRMGLTSTGEPLPENGESIPDFGAASDGDADRNMILGKRFFVSPSDSVAVLAAQSQCIPYFAGGLKAVARSMPTSGALDLVAKALNVPLFEVPTGWKFFGNLMDSAALFGKASFVPLICGEESFGTGSDHVREKDGIWAVLAWLSVLAEHNHDAGRPLVTVQQIVENHWKRFGRNYYCRYDYENVSTTSADALMAHLRSLRPAAIPPLEGIACTIVDDFEYTDPVDGSVSSKQGLRFIYADGSRFVFRLSGTGSQGATIRLYLERFASAAAVTQHLGSGSMPSAAQALSDLVQVALNVSQLAKFTGRERPTVIT